jgi:hypothetical protein
MSILESIKYWLEKKGVISKADNIADAVKELADNDNMLLIVTQDRSNNTFIWEQNYTFDEIYERALKGRRILQVRFINSLEQTEGMTWDMAKTYLPLGISNEHHESGRGVVFYGDGMSYYWSESGFVFSYDD